MRIDLKLEILWSSRVQNKEKETFESSRNASPRKMSVAWRHKEQQGIRKMHLTLQGVFNHLRVTSIWYPLKWSAAQGTRIKPEND